MADRRRVATAVTALLLVALAAVLLVQSGLLYPVFPPDPDSYERTTVTAYDANGTQLATVDVRVADTRAKRWVGLSDTEDLPMGEGMLFVHPNEAEHGYVMRNMSVPLDIVFVDASERVTTIHHASVPENGDGRTYAGRGKWVLEVPRGWANRTGLDAGDRVAVPPAANDTRG
jgi:uncharacterized membrane protein (UPF0127 family)